MSESDYHKLAQGVLDSMTQTLEDFDQSGQLEAEFENAVLTLTLNSGKQYLISKHAPTRQIWVSSPISGGLHFVHDGAQWKLPDGRELHVLVAAELETLAGIKVVF